MPSTFKIHPAIGIARLGNYRPPNEPDADFFITPESPAGLPIECDGKTGLPHTTKDGKEVTTDTFKKNGQIVRQAARFRIYAYDDDGTATEVVLGHKVTVLEIPRQFSGEVTLHRTLVRDRQILVIDDKILFEGGGASAGRLEVGDQVNVRGIRRFGMFNDRYEIIGPSRGPFVAVRLRCESTDLGADSRRKCDTLLPEAAD